jgi:hypothetical protein
MPRFASYFRFSRRGDDAPDLGVVLAMGAVLYGEGWRGLCGSREGVIRPFTALTGIGISDGALCAEAFCPELSVSGQRNLLKPALENQSLAVSRMAGFLGKRFSAGSGCPIGRRGECSTSELPTQH